MTKEEIKYLLRDLRYFTLIPKKYKTTRIADFDERNAYWSKVAKDYYNFKKRVDSSDYHWYVITYKDGRKELAYFKVWRLVLPHGGGLCRLALVRRYFGTQEYEHVKDIRLAF